MVLNTKIQRKSFSLRYLLVVAAMLALAPAAALAKNASDEICPRPAAGSTVPEPKNLRSQNGTLRVELRYRSVRDAQGRMRYCYQSADGSTAPNLRVHPGDWLILSLKNDLKVSPIPATAQGKAMTTPIPMQMPMPVPDPCADGEMDGLSTNLHFHGLSVPPICHQDDVLRTMIAPGDAPFEYRFQIPPDTPPGLYWYHPYPSNCSLLPEGVALAATSSGCVLGLAPVRAWW